jgi:hypothetical protein
MPVLIYIFGEPGAGKSTLVRDALGKLIKEGMKQTKPFAHTVFRMQAGFAAYLGADDGSLFPGTDRLSMGVQPKAIQFLKTCGISTVIAEGDRLGTKTFLGEVVQLGWHVLAIHAISDKAAQHRAERAKAAGKPQNETWVKGRISKVLSLAEWCQDRSNVTYTNINTNQERPKAGKQLCQLLKIPHLTDKPASVKT